jgi:xanthine dehydrogenase small subunit
MKIDTPKISLNGVRTPIDDVPPTTTLLDWLRDHARLRGTKEGCAEGDCGACAVVLERLGPNDRVDRYGINACLTMIGQLDGLGVRTVEGLAGRNGSLHPIQSALAAGAATQCGFCTPGFVMSGYAFATSGAPAQVSFIHDAMAGNLCRCTGYRPIVDALMQVLPLENDPLDQSAEEIRSALGEVSRNASICLETGANRFYVPSTLSEARELRVRHPQSVLLAGGTDLGLLVSQKREEIPLIIHLGKLRDLKLIEERDDSLVIGAGVTYTEAFEVLTRHFPNIRTYWTRIGSPAIRNMGTIGGNIGTASPIGDVLPLLLALDARIKVGSQARGTREIEAEQFFLDYRKTALAPDELIEAVLIPAPSPDVVFFVDKISKRRDQDISCVCGAYFLRLQDEVIHEVRLAFGGLAAKPRRARKAEGILLNRRLSEAAAVSAGEALAQEFQPISDLRGSADYRLLVAKNLMRRLWLRMTTPDAPLECDAL